MHKHTHTHTHRIDDQYTIQSQNLTQHITYDWPFRFPVMRHSNIHSSVNVVLCEYCVVTITCYISAFRQVGFKKWERWMNTVATIWETEWCVSVSRCGELWVRVSGLKCAFFNLWRLACSRSKVYQSKWVCLWNKMQLWLKYHLMLRLYIYRF